MNIDFDTSVGPTPKLFSRKINTDKRGFFEELHGRLTYLNPVAQANCSYSKKNVFRGLHWQIEPEAIDKQVLVLSGCIEDVVVDLRQNSQTFLKCNTYVLHSGYNLIDGCLLEDCNQPLPMSIFIPKGFAHGFAVLSESGAHVVYTQSGLYSEKAARSLNVFDSTLVIPWQEFKLNAKSTIMSDQDTFARCVKDFDTSEFFS